jgi:RNA polymerase sigma factor (sigma-70 family)
LVKSSLAKPNGARSREETEASEELYRLCEPIIRARVRGVHPARNEIDDLVQDVWVLLLRELPSWDFDPALGAFHHGWIASIASREAWRHARRHRKRRAHSVDLEVLRDVLISEIDGHTGFEMIESREEARVVLAELEARLSPLSVRVLRLRVFDAKSIPQIAAEAGCSFNCVKMRLRRARHVLEAILRRRGSGPPQAASEKIVLFEKSATPFGFSVPTTLLEGSR